MAINSDSATRLTKPASVPIVGAAVPIGTHANDEGAAAKFMTPRQLHQGPLKNLLARKTGRRLFLAATIGTDILCILGAFILASSLRLGFYDWEQLVRIFQTIIPIHLMIALSNKGYRPNILTDWWKNISRGGTAMLVAAGSMLLILFLFKSGSEFSRVLFVLGTVLAVAAIVLSRVALFALARRVMDGNPFADLCIYDDVPYTKNARSYAIAAKDCGLKADASDPQAVSRLGELASGMDRIVIHCSPEKRRDWVFLLQALDVSSEVVVPELDILNPLEIRKRSGRTSLLISAGMLRWDQLLFKRVFDLAFTLAALPFVLPIIVLFAVLIRMESAGNPFFIQERIGLGNRKFRMIKLRSMRAEATDHHGNRSASRDDDRVTRIGKLIRMTSIDELPQVFNVLIGDMSIVGPRPHAMGSRAEDSLFWDIDQRYWHRHVVKPGLTGLAQVRGFRGATEVEADLENRLQSDLEYVANWSLWGDIRIIFQTFAVLFHRNAF